MSLKAVRHAKQRLAPDPRNLHWANDTNKFGFKMMEKMGWAQGKGLGANEDGVQEHVKVRLKENHLGVGATKKSSDNWLGNTDAFSRLLADLNERVENDAKEEKASGSSEDKSDDEAEKSDDDKSKKSKKEKKDAKEKKSKKEKKDKKDKKDKKERKDKKEKKSKKSSDEEDGEDRSNILAAMKGRKASRHKYLRNKNAAFKSADRLNEILGIKSETASPATSGMSTPVLEEPMPMTSTDIFAARMQMNSQNNSSVNEEPARPVFGGLGFATSSGIGSTGYTGSGLRGLGFVKATVSVMPATIETQVKDVVIETKPVEVTSTESKEDKKEKKEKKEKKDKKDKKRKSESDESSRSKKSKK